MIYCIDLLRWTDAPFNVASAVPALQTTANSLAISVIRERRGVARCCRSFRAVLGRVEHGKMLPEQNIVRGSGRVGPLLLNALGHVARDGNSASGRAAGFSPDEGESHFNVEFAPGLVRRTGQGRAAL